MGRRGDRRERLRFPYLPRLTGDHGTYATVMSMLRDEIDGYFLLGQNPAVGSAHGKMQRLGLAHLKWLVVRDLNLIESATFWKDAPEIETGELKTEEIDTEVFFFPAAAHVEKDGTFTQTQRMLQWHHKAVAPARRRAERAGVLLPARPEDPARLAGSTAERDRPILDLTWDYPLDDHGEISAEAVLAEINGIHLTGDKAGQPLTTFNEMKADGSTSGGCWIYTGVYADGVNQSHAAARSRAVLGRTGVGLGLADEPPHPLQPRLGRPRRQALERAQGVRLVGRGEQKWTGHDVPDFEVGKPPSYRPPEGAVGPAALRGDDPFIMQADGKGWLYAPSWSAGRPDADPLRAAGVAGQQPDVPPAGQPDPGGLPARGQPSNPSGDEPGWGVYPYVFTTYRLTEHHTAGGMSRWQPYLSELQPEFFCEVSPELARERGLENNGWATIISARTAVEARVLVTERVSAAAGGGADRAPDRAALPLGRRRRRPGQRRLGERPVRGHPRPERPHPGDQGRLVRHPARPPARAVRRCWTTSRSTGDGPASPATPATRSGRRPCALSLSCGALNLSTGRAERRSDEPGSPP